jgi:S-adenosylmethionine decarboxylase
MKKTKRSLWANDKIKNHNSLGIHLIADFWFGKKIEDPKKLEKILINTAKEARNTPLKVSIYKFHPQGITGVILLAESHIAIHTWPEVNYMAIDIFTCGEKALPGRALRYLKKVFQPKKVETLEIKRGKLK